MAKQKHSAKKKQPPKKDALSFLVPALSVIALFGLALADLYQVNDIPNTIYIGLIGSILGAKFTDVFGGKK